MRPQNVNPSTVNTFSSTLHNQGGFRTNLAESCLIFSSQSKAMTLNNYKAIFVCHKFNKDIFFGNLCPRYNKKSFYTYFAVLTCWEKKVENNFFIWAAVLCANISQIFFSQFDHQKYLRCLFKSLFKWSPHFFHILQQACWNFNWIELSKMFAFSEWSTRTKYMPESETDQMLCPNI